MKLARLVISFALLSLAVSWPSYAASCYSSCYDAVSSSCPSWPSYEAQQNCYYEANLHCYCECDINCP